MTAKEVMTFLLALVRHLGREARSALPHDSQPPEAGNGSYTDGGAAGVAARFLGIDVGDESTNFQAGMWLIGLVAVLATAIPAVFLEPSLGYRRSYPDWTPGGMLRDASDAVWREAEMMLARARRKYERQGVNPHSRPIRRVTQ